MPDRQTIRRRLPDVEPLALDAAFKTALGADYLGLHWQPPDPQTADPDGVLDVYLRPGALPSGVDAVLADHRPAHSRQARQQVRDRAALAQQQLVALSDALDEDWSQAPPVDALERLQAALLAVLDILDARFHV